MTKEEIQKIMPPKRRFLSDVLLVYTHQILNIIFAFISVPIALSFFGAEQYGLLAIIWTLVTYLGLVNFGLPIAARVFLSANNKIEDRKKIFFIIFRLLLLISIAFIIIILVFPDLSILVLGSLPKHIESLANDTLFICFLLYLFSIPFLIYLEGFSGIGLIGRVKLYEIANLFLGFFCLIVVVKLDLSIYELFLYRGILTLAMSLIATIDLYLKIIRTVPEQRLISEEKQHERFKIKWQSITKTALLQFMTGIASILVWHTDNLIVSHFFGLEDVTKYSITFRLISTAFIIFTAINTVMSPLYGLSFGSKQFQQINENYTRVITFIPLIGGLVWIGSINFAPEIIFLWVGNEGNAGLPVIFILGGYGFCLALNHSYMALISAINIMKYVPILGFIEASLNLGFSIMLASLLGLYGVALGTLFGGLFSAIMLPLLILKESELKIKQNWSYSLFQLFFIVSPFLAISIFIRILELSLTTQVFISILIVLAYTVVCLYSLPKIEIEWLKKITNRIPNKYEKN